MPNQKKIRQFFSPPPKRALYGMENQLAESKKAKLEKTSSPPSSSNEEFPEPEKMKSSEINFASIPVIVGSTWKKVIMKEMGKEYLKRLDKFVTKERNSYTIYPPIEQVFSWTLHHTLTDVRVVILGQDPYHGPQQAHGLCFSVQNGVRPPPSLKNIYKELAIEYEDFKVPDHGNLTEWAKQGVLLLNAVLTVRASKANSHKGQGWETFTDSIISWISKNNEGVVFILWGAYAQKKGSNIDKKRHLVLKSVHPSPLSAHNGFFHCSHFTKANDYLVKNDRQPIKWDCL